MSTNRRGFLSGLAALAMTPLAKQQARSDGFGPVRLKRKSWFVAHAGEYVTIKPRNAVLDAFAEALRNRDPRIMAALDKALAARGLPTGLRTGWWRERGGLR